MNNVYRSICLIFILLMQRLCAMELGKSESHIQPTIKFSFELHKAINEFVSDSAESRLNSRLPHELRHEIARYLHYGAQNHPADAYSILRGLRLQTYYPRMYEELYGHNSAYFKALLTRWKSEHSVEGNNTIITIGESLKQGS